MRCQGAINTASKDCRICVASFAQVNPVDRALTGEADKLTLRGELHRMRSAEFVMHCVRSRGIVMRKLVLSLIAGMMAMFAARPALVYAQKPGDKSAEKTDKTDKSDKTDKGEKSGDK